MATATSTIENRYNCPKALWRKFSEKRKIVYNNIRAHKKEFVIHPDTEINRKEWETISHNFACLAAWEVE